MGLDYDRDRLYLGNFIPLMTAMFTRTLWTRVGGMDETLDYYEDWDLWLRMCEFATPQHLPGITAEYRIVSAHPFDEHAWTQKIYAKHRAYWTPERMVEIWKRLDILQYENRALRKQLQALDSNARLHRRAFAHVQARVRRMLRVE